MSNANMPSDPSSDHLASEQLDVSPQDIAEASAAVSPNQDPVAKPKKKHKARIEHKIPGRIRMKIPHGKANPEVLKAYSAAFASIPGLTKVHAKPETGRIVLEYDPKYEADFHHHFNHACDNHDTHVHSSERPG